MKSFFFKQDSNFIQLSFFLKYDIPIDYNVFKVINYEEIPPKYRIKLLKQYQYISISACSLNQLPNNIKNNKLTLSVWFPDKYHEYPENWDIFCLKINFKFDKQNIPTSFKYQHFDELI